MKSFIFVINNKTKTESILNFLHLLIRGLMKRVNALKEFAFIDFSIIIENKKGKIYESIYATSYFINISQITWGPC